MSKFLLLLGLCFCVEFAAQGNPLAKLNQGFDPRSQLRMEKAFSFYESCESIPVEVLGLDPVTRRPRDISITVYRPRPGSHRSVLVIPPTGGVSGLDVGYGERLCGRGIEAWVITEWAPEVRDFKLGIELASHDRSARQALAAVRHIINHMPGKIGILGTSAGAIIGAVAIAIDPRITVGALIAGGADLPSLFENSRMDSLENLRQQRMQAFGWAPESYEKGLRSAIAIDPARFGPGLRRKKIGVVVSFDDEIVPSRNQLLLEKISGAERIAEFEKSHFVAILMTAFFKSYKVENFFSRNL